MMKKQDVGFSVIPHVPAGVFFSPPLRFGIHRKRLLAKPNGCPITIRVQTMDAQPDLFAVV